MLFAHTGRHREPLSAVRDEWGPLLESKYPDQAPSGEQAFLKVGGLKPARLTLLCTGGNGNLC